jgi:hypothetical protein
MAGRGASRRAFRESLPGSDTMRFGQVSGNPTKAILKTAAAALLLGTAAWGQTDYFLSSATYGFTADKLYLGAEFRVTGLVTVTLKNNHALALGELWYINPTNGQEVFLFRNKDLPKPSVTLPALPIGQTLTFFYKTTEPMYNNDKKYSGPNIPGVSQYVNPMSSDANLDPNKRWGARYCAVGRERTAPGGALTGNLEFGYEDESDHNQVPNINPPRSWSDMDFNDIIFSVSGLEMGIQTRSLASKGLVK